MTDPFILKAFLAIVFIGCGLALLIWNRKAKEAQRKAS